MKRILIILLVAGIALASSAQTRTEAYMKKIPALPKDSCNATRASAEEYREIVSMLKEQVVEEHDAIKESVDSFMESNESAIQDNVMKQMSQTYSVSQADIDKMKNSKNMTAAEKQAMASSMMSQQANMSMEEAKNLGKMSEAGKKAYAEALATEKMATVQADPKQASKTNYAGSMFQSTISQQEASAKIAEINSNIAALYSPIENDPGRKKMLDRISEWNNKLTSMMGIVSDSDSHVMDSLGLLVKNEQIAYCNKYTLNYRNVLRKHLQLVKSSMPDYKNLGDITAESTKIQTGIEMPAEGKEISSLEAIAYYLQKLADVFDYQLYYSEDY